MNEDLPEGKLAQLSRRRVIELLVQHFHVAEQQWDDGPARLAALGQILSLLNAHRDKPFIGRIVDHLDPETVSLDQLYTLMVPIEREHEVVNLRDEDFLPSTVRDGDEEVAHMPVTVVLDNLRGAFNIGGIFRTCECMGVERVVTAGYTASPDHPKVQKAALGAVDQVSWRSVPRVDDALAELRDRPVIALEVSESAQSLYAFRFDFPCTLVLGNERFGLNPSVVDAADAVVQIPMCGQKNSLNVVSSFAMCAYEMRRQFTLQ